MINVRNVKKYCKDFTKIENYEEAVADTTTIWECHHVLERFFKRKQLIEDGCYYDVEPECLIFLTPSEHKILHTTFSYYEETKQKLSELRKGDKNPFYGKHHTEEQKKFLSKRQTEHNIGCHWWNNGIREKFCREQPLGWVKGRLKRVYKK